MTTATRQAPPHGSLPRARGSRGGGIRPCPCEPCRRVIRAYSKHRIYLIHTGRSLLTDAAPTRSHLRYLMAHGDALTNIARQVGRPRSSLAAIVNGTNKRINRQVANTILAIRPGNATASNWSVPAIGSIRRVRALMAIGHPLKAIQDAAHMEHTAASYLVNGHRQTIHHELAQRVDKAYRQLCTTRGTSVRSMRRADREGWPPAAAWDDDTIDDPQAHPDWTGHCGTDRGWWMHKQQQLPACDRCEKAHAAWLAERKHLPQGERFRALGIARGQASNRGAAIAHDARELMRISGLTHEQAAERLGVTLSHLHQELARHPELAAA